VVGDGAVGKAAAVALSVNCTVVLVGPPGTPESFLPINVSGDRPLTASIRHSGLDTVKGPVTVVAALKAYDISEAVPFIRRFSAGPIVCLSNGMGLEEEWGSMAPKIEYAVLTAGFTNTGPSTVTAVPGSIYCSSGGVAEHLFSNTFLNMVPVPDIEAVRWAKWYANSIINPLGALAGIPNDQLRNSKSGLLIGELEKELAPLMPSGSSLEKGREMLNWLLDHSPNRCSMLQDIEAGRETEIDFLTGFCVKKLRDRCPAASRVVNLVKSRT